jgi:hypothetical protein
VQETNKQKLQKENKRALKKILFIVKNCHEYNKKKGPGRMDKITKGHYKIMAFCY